MPKKKNNNIIFVLISIIIIVFVILVINVVRLFIKPTETTLVRNGELTKYEEVIGYIIRDESVIDTSSYEGILEAEIEDLTRVKKDGVIAKYVSESEEYLMNQIKELDTKIQETMESQQTIYNSDVKMLENNIQIQIYENAKNVTNVNLLKENKMKLNEYIKKKAQIVGELSPVGSKLKQLIDERNGYEKEINNAKKELRAPVSGLVSYRVDGYENVLTKQSISSLNSEKLSSFKLNVNQIIPRDSSCIKIINNFECYISMFMDSKESMQAELNDKLYLRFEGKNDSLIPATIEYISEEDKGRLITVKIETNTEELAKYRKINLDVVWWSYSGFKLHKSLIKTKDVSNLNGEMVKNLNYVEIAKAGYNDEAYVKVVKEFGDYVIVENYSNEDYLEMGFTELDIENFVTLKMYNEVVVSE